MNQGAIQAVKNNARRAVVVAIQKGELKQQECAVCFTRKTYAHHPDYNKPLKVIWLCRKHHSEAHRKNPSIQPSEESIQKVGERGEGDSNIRIDRKTYKLLKIEAAQQGITLKETVASLCEYL